jgi:DNA-binding MarR family transcriptional regulator
MGRLKRLNLLEFLSKPRFLHEIVEHYKVSKKTAVFHLKEAMKSGQVLVSEAPAFQTIKDSAGKLKKLSGLLYVYQKSPILVGNRTRLSILETDNFISELDHTSRISFLLKPNDVLGKATLERGSTGPALVKKARAPKNRGAKLRANSSLVSKLKVSWAKVTSANSTRPSRLLSSKQYSNSKLEPLLNVEKIRLFQALLKEPLPFLDIRKRFNVSRQTITRLVKRGLLTETWGSKGVGLRFKLTSKGKACLKQLEEASKYELKIREGPLTRLKQRSIV